MTPVAALITAISLVAALVARLSVAKAARNGGVAEHLRRLFTLIALLVALRLANFAWPSPLAVACLMVIASWLPLAALRLGEELVRRHAPRPLKLFALGGAILFSILAASLGLVWTREAILALAVFQGLVLAGILWHLLRQRNTLTSAERRAPDMLALAFLLAIPLLASDFERLFPVLSIRGGPFAALVLMLACSRLIVGAGRPLALLGDIAVIVGVAGLAALGAHLVTFDAIIITWTVFYCAAGSAALLLLIERLAGRAQRNVTILERLANVPHQSRAILSSHPLLESAVSVGANDLVDLPPDMIEKLAQRRVIPLNGVSSDSAIDDAAREVLNRHGASHLMLCSRQPVGFLAIAGGSFDEDRLTDELKIVARLLEHAA